MEISPQSTYYSLFLMARNAKMPKQVIDHEVLKCVIFIPTCNAAQEQRHDTLVRMPARTAMLENPPPHTCGHHYFDKKIRSHKLCLAARMILY
jgi:hypothetical protein